MFQTTNHIYIYYYIDFDEPPKFHLQLVLSQLLSSSQDLFPGPPAFEGSITVSCRNGGPHRMGPEVSRVSGEVVDGTSGNQTIDVVVSVGVLSILPQQRSNELRCWVSEYIEIPQFVRRMIHDRDLYNGIMVKKNMATK